MEIQIRDIQDIPVKLYKPDGTLIGTIYTVLQFDDVRVQICEQKLKGYYVMFNEHKIEIDEDGRYNNYDGFFDVRNELLMKLV